MSERTTDYTNAAQQRILRLVLAMFGDVVQGYPPSALAKAVGCKPPVMTRDLFNLQALGLVERLEDTAHWRLTPRLPQQAIKIFNAIDAAERRVEEGRNRYTRRPG